MIADLFKTAFDNAPRITHFTPGRVNILGEHTDYNGGMVLPTALDLGITIALSPRIDNLIRIKSDAFDDLAERKTSDTAQEHWSDYVTGAVKLANAEGLTSGGTDIAIATTLPFGAGISSSAAVTRNPHGLARRQ